MSPSHVKHVQNRKQPPAANRVLLLLMTSVGINYIDRGALSISAPLISHELSLSPAQLGLLFSGFFWTYSVLQPLAGWLVDRYNVSRVFGAGYFLWSLATGSMAFTHQFVTLFSARLALGAGESVAYPAYSRILVQHFEENRRGFANALVEASAKAGPALSTLIGGLIVARFGWRVLFFYLGLVSLLWLVPWALWGPSGPAVSKTAEVCGIGQIMRRREAWGTSLGMFALGYVWSFLLSWLPTYMVNERDLSMRMVAVVGSLPFWMMAVTALTGGWLSDRWIASGGSVTRVRKTFLNIGLLVCCATLWPAALVHNAWTALALILISSAALGLFTSNVWAVTQTLAGPAAAGSWSGMQNAIGNLGGILSPYLTGVIIERTGSYHLAFATCSAVLLAGVASYATLVSQIKPLQWGSVEDPASETPAIIKR